MRISSEHDGGLRWRQVLAAAIVCTCVGCSGPSAPRTVAVHGKVTYRGQPVAQGTVSFQPVKAAEGYPLRPATGDIAPDGSYQLSTFAAGDGAVPGEYRVVIVSKTSEATLENPHAAEHWFIPEKYGNAEQSGLTAIVPADSAEDAPIDFDLTD